MHISEGVESFIEASNKAATIKELFEAYKKPMHKLGFDRIIFSLMNDHAFIDRSAQHGLVLNYPDVWMKYYGEKGYQNIDPVRAAMYTSHAPFTWDAVVKAKSISKQQVTLMNEGREAGLHTGIGIPLLGARGAIAGVGAASSSAGIDLHDSRVSSFAYLLSQQFYLTYIKLEAVNAPLQMPPALSNREQEVLKWAAQGKTKSQIGDILGISHHTVHSYAKIILKKLDVKNITMAVLKAVQLGLIQL